MHKHYSNGPRVVRQARRRRAAEEPARLQGMMVWMAYAALIAWGLFLRAAGWM